MSQEYKVNLNSEIGQLEAVILHKPGAEVENMKPANAHRALYSDILNVEVANQEYAEFISVLDKLTTTFEMQDLLRTILQNDTVRQSLVNDLWLDEEHYGDDTFVKQLSTEQLSIQLIEGIRMQKNSLSKFLMDDRYSLKPLYNFFFMRDASMSFGDKVVVGKMANAIRSREALIMDYIFKYHPFFEAETINLNNAPQNAKMNMEGGDFLVPRHDILLIGMGIRTSPEAIDFLINELNNRKTKKHIIIQELPHSPESFIHLDMVFTLLDHDKCMVYSPIILGNNQYRTIQIDIEGGKTQKIEEVPHILHALKQLGMDLQPIYCGGSTDRWIQDREQWHSGANFFAFAPGKVIGYGRNSHTIEALNQAGFDIISAYDVLEDNIDISKYHKCVITIEGSELARGGGGARCMTMPVRRKSI